MAKAADSLEEQIFILLFLRYAFLSKQRSVKPLRV
jgi:hypothetical protein